MAKRRHAPEQVINKLREAAVAIADDGPVGAVITCRQTGASVWCVGSAPRRMHGLTPRLLIGDGLAQWKPTKVDKALVALQTSMGEIPDAKAVWIGYTGRPARPSF